MLNKSHHSDGNHFFYSIGLFHSLPLDLRTWFHFNSSQFQNKQKIGHLISQRIHPMACDYCDFVWQFKVVCVQCIFSAETFEFPSTEILLKYFVLGIFPCQRPDLCEHFCPWAQSTTIHAYMKRMPLEYTWNYVGYSAQQLHLCARVWTHEWRPAYEIDHFHLICFLFIDFTK